MTGIHYFHGRDNKWIGKIFRRRFNGNKLRGLVTTARDEQGRPTVFRCFEETWTRRQPIDSKVGNGGTPSLPRVFPVGRLDQASEGLLLFTNDTAWAARITDPQSHVEKRYHAQVDCQADETLARRVREGIIVDGDFLAAKRVRVLRQGMRNSWLEVALDQGKNRHIRRLLAALGVDVLRLVRVAIGPVQLGTLAKGKWRHLTPEEVSALATTRLNKSM